MSLDSYDAPTGAYTSSIPPGTAALRSVIATDFDYSRTEVVRDRSRCNHTRSEHCECGAIDAFTTDPAKGRHLFDRLVAASEALGIQSVIFRDREIGFGNPTERHRSKRDHFDHVHVGLNRWARANLTQARVRQALKTQEDDMFEDGDRDNLKACVDALYAGGVSAKGEPLDRFVKAHFQALTARLEALAGESKERDLRAIAVLEELRERPPGGVSEVDARAVVDEFWKRLEA